MLWILATILMLIWSGGMLFHKGGWFHLFLLSAIALVLIQLIAGRRAV